MPLILLRKNNKKNSAHTQQLIVNLVDQKWPICYNININ